MKIKGKLAMDIVSMAVRTYGDTKTRVANLKVAVKVEEETAEAKFGEDLYHAAFSGMRTGKDGGVKHSAAVITKPNVTCEVHEVEIAGHTFRISPEVSKLTPVEGEPRVVAEMVLPLPAAVPDAKKVGDVLVCVGELHEMDWSAELPDLPGISKIHQGAFGNPTAKPA